jgi:lipopolysaccharide/colanic/teichoic acid biosynthesis glycosyltransferase
MLYLTRRDVSRWLFALFLMLDWALLLGWRVIARMAFRLAKGSARPRRVLVVGAGEVGCRVAEMIGEHSWTGLTLEGYLDDAPDKEARGLPVLGTLDDAAQVVHEREIDEVVIALPPCAWEQVNQLVVTLHTLPVDVHVVPDYFALTLWRATAEDLAGVPMVNLRAPAIAIKLDSPGPILFKQQRVGENGKLFWMYKFRSMVVDAEKMVSQVVKNTADGKVTYKHKNDPRVTLVGRFIRHTSLDELPQLFNVLKGDMSLVGPRPELPWLVELYEPWQRKRFAVPQGITGWWQVNGRSDKEMHLHTDEDLFYIQNYSLWLDICILLKTPWVALRGRGAY